MKKVLIGILIIILIGAIAFGIKFTIDYINDNTNPIVYYSINNSPYIVLEEDNEIFSNNLNIMWTTNCKGTIKKDEKIYSKENKALLATEGTYEINVKSPSGKNKITKTVIIDKTPPNMDITKKSEGSYVINFKDIADVSKLNIIRYNKDTKELISEENLTNSQIKQNMEIKESGYYMISAVDKHGNVTKNFEFTVE